MQDRIGVATNAARIRTCRNPSSLVRVMVPQPTRQFRSEFGTSSDFHFKLM
jgi:hypothetical protein